MPPRARRGRDSRRLSPRDTAPIGELVDVRAYRWDRCEEQRPGELTVTYVGSPHAGYFDVDRVELAESEEEVTVSLYVGDDPDLDGWVTLVGVEKTVTVRLSAPLAGRTVVDGAVEAAG